MKRRTFVAFGGLGLLTGGYMAYHEKEHWFDFLDGYQEKIVKVIESYLILETKLRYKTGESDKIKENVSKAVYIAFDDYLLGLDHVRNMPKQLTYNLGIMSIQLPVTLTDRETKLNGKALEEIVSDEDKDIAVLRLPSDYKGKRYPFGLGDSDKIKVADEIFLIGSPDLNGYIVREGIVSSKVKQWNKEKGFYISANITFGDSSSATVNRNNFKLLGLNAEQHFYNQAFVRPINEFKPYLR